MPNANRGACGFRSDEFDDNPKPSKTERKRAMLALQELGETLIALPIERIQQMALPGNLQEALIECQRIKDFEGKRRQTQYVGKLMRTLEEAELVSIQAMLSRWQGSSSAETARLHKLEKWRERLLADDAAFTELVEQFPALEAQTLRVLIRNARKERAENKPPKAYREIFQRLNQLLGSEPL